MITEKTYLRALETVREYELNKRNRLLLTDFIEFLYKREFDQKTRLINVLRDIDKDDMHLDKLTKEVFFKVRNVGKKVFVSFEKMKSIEARENHKITIKIAKQKDVLQQLAVFPNAKELLYQFNAAIDQSIDTDDEIYALKIQHKKLVDALKNKFKSDNIIKGYIE